ncbi:MAG: DUF1844 domain-containing protein [Acidimicrobiales bacterium]
MTLWTPDGERPIRRESADPTPPPPSQPPAPPGGSTGPGDEPTPEEMQAHMDALRDQLAQTPADVVVANHAFGLFELAAIHLSLQPPQLDEARLAIDALAALVEGLAGRLGEAEAQLTDGLSQLRLAFVQVRGASESGSP